MRKLRGAGRAQGSPHTFLLHEPSRCGGCGTDLKARVVLRDGAAWALKFCARCGQTEEKLDDDAQVYLDSLLARGRVPEGHTGDHLFKLTTSTCSLAGVKMMEAPVHYSAAKAALRGFTEALAKEVGRYGVTVNCLAPGVLEDGVSANVPPARLQDYLKHCALGRVGTFAECAEVAAFLVSDRNSYMNGATVVLDGAV